MDSSPAPTAPVQEEDEWDNDDFVIPDLGIGGGGDSILVEKKDASVLEIETTTSPTLSPKVRKEESIYLGPHGAPPSSSSQSSSSSRKQQFKQKLKEADKRISGTGRENKLENLKELVGGHPPNNMSNSKGSTRDWLDPHCHESHFDKPTSH